MTVKYLVDWEKDGFGAAIDDITAFVIDSQFSNGMRAMLQQTGDGMTLNLQVVNTDNRFTPENTGSPLYPYHAMKQRPAKVQWVDGGGTITLWYGWVDVPTIDYEPLGAGTGSTIAALKGYGVKSLIQNIDAIIPIFNDVTVDVIIKHLLNISEVPALVSGSWRLGRVGASELGSTTLLVEDSDYSNLDTGVLIVGSYGDAMPSNVYAAINDLIAAEGVHSRFYFARDGKATFYNRNHWDGTTTNAGTITDTTNAAVGLAYSYGETIYNSIKVTSMPRQSDTSQTLWTLDTPLTCGGLQTINTTIKLRKSTGQFAAAAVLIPVPTFSAGTALVTVEPQGGNALLTISNASTTDAVLSACVISGVPTVIQNELTAEQADDSSIVNYGRQQRNIKSGALTTYEQAAQLAVRELQRAAVPTGEVRTIKLETAADGTANANQLNWIIGDRLRIDLDSIYHDSEHYIIGAEHAFEHVGNVHRTTFFLEPEPFNPAGWALGESGASELGLTTILN